MKNKILSWMITIALCVVLIPIGCFLLILNAIWSITDRVIKLFGR